MKENETIEKEVKVIEIDKDEMIRKLGMMGAKKVFDGDIDMLFFDTSSCALKKGHITLRVRKKTNRLDGKVMTEVTLKKKPKDSEDSELIKVREEYEFMSDDFERTVRFFENLGYKKKYRIMKERISFELDGISYELDKYDRIPWIMEIEAKDLDTIREAARRLGIEKDRLLAWSINDLLTHYNIGKNKA